MRIASFFAALVWCFWVAHAAHARQTYPLADWTCLHSADTEQPYARFEIVRSPVWEGGSGISPLWEVQQPFECQFPWGLLKIEVLDYFSPGDSGKCGLAHTWGLRVTVDGKDVLYAPAPAARECLGTSFPVFYGTVRADARFLEVCERINVGAHGAEFLQPYDCIRRWDNELRAPNP